MKAAATFSCAATVAFASPSPDVLAKFHDFRSKWGHKYVGTEFTRRLGFFEKHLKAVEHLQQIETGSAIYSHLGPFADSSPEEMTQRFGWHKPRILEQFAPAPFLNNSVPTSLDWVAKGCVNPIQNQGQCGSCWAFSTVANLEGTACVSNNGRLVKLSEQNIVDCDKSDDGCDGGDEGSALTWSAQNGGVASERDYPYRGRDGTCKHVAKLVQNRGHVNIRQDDDSIKQALVKYGPLSIAVDANGFNGYHGGVLQNPSCSKSALNHAINLVGYGMDRVPYWKIRNSWGSQWGEEGYIRLYRGDCSCGLCKEVVTATGVTISNSPTPTPPSPSPPGPSPTPPGPSPCTKCEWNSECPSGQSCYYPSSSASSGCCSASPPYSNEDTLVV